MTRPRRGPYKPRRPATVPSDRSVNSLVGLVEAATVVGMSARGLQKL